LEDSMGTIASMVDDALNRIKNASESRHPFVLVKKSKFIGSILEVMKKYGYIEDYQDDVENKYHYKVTLKYYQKLPIIKDIKVISKSSRRLYIGYKDIKTYRNNMGITIISTSKGVMSTMEAKKLGIGGMLVCKIW